MKFRPYLLSILILLSGTAIADEQWSYEGKGAPENWGDLSPDWTTCKTGKNQSPVDIHATIKGNLPKLKMDYITEADSIVNNGHTIQVNTDDTDEFSIDGKNFVLKQFHFHAPSENLLNGKSYPMEIHFVHADKEGQLAVVAVMVVEGKENPIVDKILKLVPKKINEVKKIDVEFNFKSLFPKNKQYYRYSGSLTTPPCSEGVIWMVLKNPVEMSKKQIKEFTALLKNNNSRPLQPLNGRQIIEE